MNFRKTNSYKAKFLVNFIYITPFRCSTAYHIQKKRLKNETQSGETKIEIKGKIKVMN